MDYTSLIKEVDIPELVKALRICSSELNCGDCPLLYRDSCSSDELMSDAAAAIEALQAEIRESMQRCAECGDELEAQMPKRGVWIDDEFTSKGRCSVCGEEWSWFDNCMETFKYCPNCGAKMEVQE